MKKTLLSIFAVAAIAFAAVSCGNPSKEYVESYKTIIEEMTKKFDEAKTIEDFNAITLEMSKSFTEIADKFNGKEISPEAATEAAELYSAFSQKVTDKIMELSVVPEPEVEVEEPTTTASTDAKPAEKVADKVSDEVKNAEVATATKGGDLKLTK